MGSTVEACTDGTPAAPPLSPCTTTEAATGLLHPQLHISCAFESGNIEVLDASDPFNIRLAIRPDPYCEKDGRQHFQWFYFAVSGAAHLPLVLHITNAGSASYPDAWPGYEAVTSSDLITWTRIHTTYSPASGTLTLTHTPTTHHVRYAYFAPYTNAQTDALVTSLADKPGVYLHTLPPTHEGRPLYLLRVSHPSLRLPQGLGPVTPRGGGGQKKPLVIWVLGRQHPGEPQGSWFVEGMLKTLAAAAAAAAGPAAAGAGGGGRAAEGQRNSPQAAAEGGFSEDKTHSKNVSGAVDGGGGSGRLDDDDAAESRQMLDVAADLLKEVVMYVVPNMCPDGVDRGHLRTNALGANLNREWLPPGDPTLSPEVYHTRCVMSATGVDLLLDVHGDEELPAVFVSGLEGLATWGSALKELQEGFKAAMCSSSPFFQTSLGYPTPAPNTANLAICSKAVAAGWGCLALTLEMPFKDAACCPDPHHGWSPARCEALGRQTLKALLDMLPLIRKHKQQ